jgi:hypothetical protein
VEFLRFTSQNTDCEFSSSTDEYSPSQTDRFVSSKRFVDYGTERDERYDSEDTESVEDTKTLRDIAGPLMGRLHVAVGTGTYVLRYDRHNVN